MTLVVILIYLAMVMAIGLLSHRLFRGTGEDYFLATRTIGPFLLLMSLFGSSADAEEAWQPAIFFILYGWAMLGWHVYSQERKARTPQNPQDLHEGRART